MVSFVFAYCISLAANPPEYTSGVYHTLRTSSIGYRQFSFKLSFTSLRCRNRLNISRRLNKVLENQTKHQASVLVQTFGRAFGC